MSKKILLVLIVLFFGVGGIILYQSLRIGKAKNSVTQEKCDQFTTTQDCKLISLATSTWKVFGNTKYGYVISYPSESGVSTDNDYANDLREEKEIGFYIPGRFPLVGVDVTVYPNPSSSEVADELNLKSYAESMRVLQINNRDPEYLANQKTEEMKRAEIAFTKAYQFTFPPVYATTSPQFPNFDPTKGLDMKSYSEALRIFNVNESLKYFQDQKIGALAKTLVDGKEAYQFTVTKGFATPNGGYLLPDGQTYMYTITENLRGQKIMIYYFLGNPIAETMYQTFVFK